VREKDKILSEIMHSPVGTSDTNGLWWGHDPFKPTLQQVNTVVNTPLTQFGPGPAVFGQQGSITNAAPASMREQTEQMLRPMTGTDFSRGMTGSQSGIGMADFVPGVGTPAAVADFMDVRNKVKTGEAGPLDYGLTGAGVALSAVPGGVAAKKILQKGVNYSSKLMDQVLDRAKNVTATPTDWAPTGRGIEIRPKDHPDDPNLVEETVKYPYSQKEVEDNYAGFEEMGGFPSPFQYASEVKLGEVVGADPISKAQIKSEIVNKGDVIKQDRALMERALAKTEGDKVDPRKLAEAVDKEVVPLKQKLSDSYADYDTSNMAREAGGKFKTVIYQGPLYHGADNHFNDPYYFAHTRRQDLGVPDDVNLISVGAPEHLAVKVVDGQYTIVDTARDTVLYHYGHARYAAEDAQSDLEYLKQKLDNIKNNQGVRRILEIQSDALQKKHNVQEILKNRHGDPELNARLEQHLNQIDSLTRKVTEHGIYPSDESKILTLAHYYDVDISHITETSTDAVIKAVMDKTRAALEAKINKINSTKEVGFTDADRMLEYQNLWQYRVAREEIKQAAIDGKKEVWFPTGPTASRIENWDDVNGGRALPDAEFVTGPNDEIFHINNLPEGIDLNNLPPGWQRVMDGNADPAPPQGWGAVGPANQDYIGPKGKMLSDPEVHEKLSRKGNPYKNEILYLEDNVQKDKEEIEYYTKQVEQYSKEGVYYSPGDKEKLHSYQQALDATQHSLKINIDTLEKMKSQSKDNVPESKYYGLYNMYQDLNKWLKKEFKAEHVTDSKGLSWVKVKINPEQADEPVRAFKSVAPFLAGGGAAAAAATQRGEDERTN
jgi:hypothetical protein